MLLLALFTACETGTVDVDEPPPPLYSPTSQSVSGEACAFPTEDWAADCDGDDRLACARDVWFHRVFPAGLRVADQEHLQGGALASALSGADEFETARTTLALNLGFSNYAVFGEGSDLAGAVLVGGEYDGWTARDVYFWADRLVSEEVSSDFIQAMNLFNQGFATCQTETYDLEAPEGRDLDGDGVTAATDCDDTDSAVGAELYLHNFDVADDYLIHSPMLTDPWVYEGGEIWTTNGGQQAQIGCAELWKDTVTYATIRADGANSGCDDCAETDRFRAGVLARTYLDLNQDEGYSGYRCAVAANIEEDCFEEGPFVQIAAFLEEEEDDLNFECYETCDNASFDQLAREERSENTDFLAGDSVDLTFWLVGYEMVCEFEGVGGESVTARAHDERFADGTTGISTLHAITAFDHLRVCEAFSAP